MSPSRSILSPTLSGLGVATSPAPGFHHPERVFGAGIKLCLVSVYIAFDSPKRTNFSRQFGHCLWLPFHGPSAARSPTLVWKPKGKHSEWNWFMSHMAGTQARQAFLGCWQHSTLLGGGVGGVGSEKWSLELSFPSRIHCITSGAPGSKIIKGFKTETAEY